jgi:organic hydroperoxide reductase OsmC/OhrA
MTTFLAIAELSKLEFVSFACRSEGLLEKRESSGYQITEITLRPRLVIRHGSDTERAFRILDKAEGNCLVSKSIKSSVRIQPEVIHDERLGIEEPEDELMAV